MELRPRATLGRCAFCHDECARPSELARCPACGVTLHSACALDLGSPCLTLGCVAPGLELSPVPTPRWARVLDWILSVCGVLLIAAALAACLGAFLIRIVQTFHGGLAPWG